MKSSLVFMKAVLLLAAVCITATGTPGSVWATHENAPVEEPFNYGVFFVIPGLILILAVIIYNIRKLNQKSKR